MYWKMKKLLSIMLILVLALLLTLSTSSDATAINVTVSNADVTPPTVTAVAPAADAVDVATDTAVSATFSEGLDPVTVHATTFELRDAANNVVAAAVSYDGVSQTASLTPANLLAYGASYTATVKGGAEGVKDLAGNALANDQVWTFTTKACPCTIWDETTLPEVESANDPDAIEVGVKFQSDVDGYIMGVRFYKGVDNTGTHTGNLWDSSGQLLATAAFVNETATGWQQVNFSNPVPVTANTTYVASYHAPNGGYAFNSGYFANEFANPPLRTLANGVDGGNGVYNYSATSTFPNSSGNGTNYWVDVVFDITIPPDNTPPTVTAVAPAADAVDVATDTAVSATFSEGLDPVTVNATTFELRDAANNVVAAAVSYDGVSQTASLTLANLLAYGASYTATVKGGAEGVKDLAGNALANDQVWTFTTKACPCTIWDETTLPAVESANDPDAIEVGVKFQSDVDGYIMGVRFYKGVDNTGTHTGNLWDSSGQLLATAAFVNETATGWQQVNFSNPVPVTANTTYVASYHAPNGGYAFNSGYFANEFANPPLRTLANSVDGGNGVYNYSVTSMFPNSSGNGTNYWVDVVFTTEWTPDTEPPVVTVTNPTDGALVAGLVTIDATATDNVGIVGVQFTLDGANLGTEDTTPPYSIDWDSSLATNGSHQIGAVARDAAGNTTASSAVNVTVDNPVDTTPPTVTAVAPAADAVDVATDTAVSATFSEGLDPTTVNATTFELRDAANNVVPAAVSYDGVSQTASLTPTDTLANGTVYTATVISGASGVKDLAGNALASDYIWSFTTIAGPEANCPCTIWDETAVPAVESANDPYALDQGIELGVKFQSDVAGYITGIRFYKGAGNTGTHTGNLWDSSGQLLATATFVNETASGWQQVNFSNPVQIAANTTYVASYHTTSDGYSVDSAYFAADGVDNPPLLALGNGIDGDNGVYKYGASGFPTSSYNAANYWVDVVFDITPGGVNLTLELIINIDTVDVVLTWDNNSPATGYEVWRNNEPYFEPGEGNSIKLVDVPASTNTYSDSFPASDNNNYYYRVRAIYENGMVISNESGKFQYMLW